MHHVKISNNVTHLIIFN